MGQRTEFDFEHFLKQVRDLVAGPLLDAEADIEMQDRVPDDLTEVMAELGLFGLTLPIGYGGLGLSAQQSALVMEQIGRVHSAVRGLLAASNGIVGKTIERHGTEAQRRSYLPGLAAGTIRSALAATEPQAGSDLTLMETEARRVEFGYELSGRKYLVTNGDRADVLVVLAQTDRVAGRRGLSAFLVDAASEAVTVEVVQPSMAPGGYHLAELRFSRCLVSAGSILGQPGQGLDVLRSGLVWGRLLLAAGAVGMSTRLVEEAARHAASRVQGGKPIGLHQTVANMLADMAIETASVRHLVRHTGLVMDREFSGRDGDNGRDRVDGNSGVKSVVEAPSGAVASSIAKVAASEAACRVADSALQVCGGRAYLAGHPVERMYREARLLRLAEGTSEMHRLSLGRALMAHSEGITPFVDGL
ncbi:MAG: acyl-CoA/acyl-ACP dehydrogenase [Deltaproteobacteria bacterium]|nr:acyl-CoA/acyl-ACP dehydrogenase [Deltaproteobacteria bacterium]